MTLHAIQLGATLYVPATRRDLLEIAEGKKYPGLRSMVVCLEDSILESEVAQGLENLQNLLLNLRHHAGLVEGGYTSRPILLVRPRNIAVARLVYELQHLSLVHGFVLPKVTAAALPRWVQALHWRDHYLLPTLETREVFDTGEVRKLRAAMSTIRERVLCVRIGGNDLLQLMGARRSRQRTAYIGPLGPVITKIVSEFAPWGFELSAPVLEDFSNVELLREEVARDLEHGLLTKTAIHPDQLAVIHDCYRVPAEEYEEARNILAPGAAAVFAAHGVMSEPATHKRWAERTLLRAETYGVVSAEQPAPEHA